MILIKYCILEKYIFRSKIYIFIKSSIMILPIGKNGCDGNTGSTAVEDGYYAVLYVDYYT